MKKRMSATVDNTNSAHTFLPLHSSNAPILANNKAATPRTVETSDIEHLPLTLICGRHLCRSQNLQRTRMSLANLLKIPGCDT